MDIPKMEAALGNPTYLQNTPPNIGPKKLPSDTPIELNADTMSPFSSSEFWG